jgi:hypothetical protein
MAKCVIFSGTRVCSGSPYRVNNKSPKQFPRLTKAMKAARLPARKVINALRIPGDQKKLANNLLDAVLAVTWSNPKTKNAKDIHESVQLFLAEGVKDMKGHYALVSY